jgi:hypothetical protein
VFFICFLYSNILLGSSLSRFFLWGLFFHGGEFFFIGALFFMVVNQAFGMLGPVLSSFDTERQVFF